MLKIGGKLKNGFDKGLRFFRDGNKPSVVEWVIVGLITAIVFFSFIYADLYAVTEWSVVAWDSLFDGRVFEYYKYCFDNVSGLNNVYNGGDIFTGFFLTLWNFPLYIAKEFFGVNILYSIPALLWSKSIYLFAQLVCLPLIYKIALKLKLSPQNAKWAVFAFCASSALFFGAYIDCQTDMLYVPLYLAGFLLLLNGKKKSSTLLFAAAIAIKPFPLIIFIPLILAVEKKPLKCILYVLEAVSIFLVFKFFAAYLPLYGASIKDITGTYLRNFFVSNFSTGTGGAALFPASYLILCVFAYIHKTEDEDYKNRLLLYLAFSALALYFAFARFDFYRIVMIAPFGALLIAQNVKNSYLLGISFTVFILSFLIIGAYTAPLVFELSVESTLERMLLSKIFGSTKFLTREYASSSAVLEEYLSIFINGVVGIYIATIALIMYFAHPKQYLKDDNYVVAKEIMWLQLLPIIIIAIIISIAYFSVV